MPLNAGTRLGPYEIAALVGAGGMGEVYRATDTRLNRTVAVKVLPAQFSQKPEALERFQREARAISQLSHANICQLYDLGEQDGVHYIVMEYLEGETLATRLAKGRLPVEQVLRYGAEIADGLDAAHRTGVVHRDLKPGNIMLTRSGAKLLDFGLAKSAPPLAAGTSGLSVTLTTPHISTPLTAEGTVIGTYQYMSPEQLEGKEADARSDIFSFGSLLYEMATGKRAFEGKSQVSVASAILEKDPEPVSTHQPLAPPALQSVVQGALMKDPNSRWQSAADIARQLRWISTSQSAPIATSPAHSVPRLRERSLWALLVAALLIALGWLTLGTRPHPRVVRASLTPPPGETFDFMGDFSGPPVLSPDGTRVAFTARGPKEVDSIWVRKLDAVSSEKLAGTEGAYTPFWSADGKSLGFFADGKLKKISATGGPVSTLADAPNARGGAWNKDNIILYAPDYRDCLWRVNASGGTPVRVTNVDPAKHTTHRWPSFLPDGNHFLYFATNHSGGRPEDNGVYFGSLDSGSSRMVLATDAAGLYSSGYLLFHQQTVLLAQKFDPARGTVSGDPLTAANEVENDAGTFHTIFTVAGDGTLLYEPGTNTLGNIDLQWMDRDGKIIGRAAESGSYKGGRLSPDGKRLAVPIGDPAASIWVLDLDHGTRTRVTFEGGNNPRMPSWSANGERIVYSVPLGATIGSGASLHAKAASGEGGEEVVLQMKEPDGSPVTLYWPQWSSDGHYLLYVHQSGPTGAAIWASPTTGDAKPLVVVNPQPPSGRVLYLRLSNDSHWLAYSASDGNREEVYVTSFPDGSGRWQISTEGGTFPVWRADGKEIYYIGFDGNLHAVEVRSQGGKFEVGKGQPLFKLRNTFPTGQPFDVSPDGKRFLVQADPEGSTSPMMLVLNWTAELK